MTDQSEVDYLTKGIMDYLISDYVPTARKARFKAFLHKKIRVHRQIIENKERQSENGKQRKNCAWTNKDIEFIRKNIEDYSHKELAEKLGKPVSSVQNYCYKHGISKRKIKKP